jgi:hypothetical protein
VTATLALCRAGLHDLSIPENRTPNGHQCRSCKAASAAALRASRSTANGNGTVIPNPLGIELYDPNEVMFVTGTDERASTWLDDNGKAVEKVLRALVRRTHSVIALSRIALSTPADSDMVQRLMIRTSIRLEESLAADREIRRRLGYLKGRLSALHVHGVTLDRVTEADIMDLSSEESAGFDAWISAEKQRKHDLIVASFTEAYWNRVKFAEEAVAEAQAVLEAARGYTMAEHMAQFGERV